MEAMMSTLGMGTRYCLVSDDHDQPEHYADEQQRMPQSALERFTDFDSVYEKFSRPAPATAPGRRESELGRTLAGGRSPAAAAGHQGKENTAPKAAADAVMSLFDRLAQRHSRTEISAFDRRFPLGHRGDRPSSRLNETQASEDPFGWSDPQKYSDESEDWTTSKPALPVYTDTPQWAGPARAATPPSLSHPAAVATPRPQANCDQAPLIDLS